MTNDNHVDAVTVDMGAPNVLGKVQLGDGYGYTEGISVSMGNPHLVIFVNNISWALNFKFIRENKGSIKSKII